jgi:hypothetical protein
MNGKAKTLLHKTLLSRPKISLHNVYFQEMTMKNILNFLIFTLLLVSCNSKVETEKPVRENLIPKGAFWVGNAESGNWLKIEEIHNHKNNARISVFDGKNGVKLVSKRFILVCSNDNQVFIKNLESEIESYDGLKIHLKSGCWLQ